MKASSEEAKEYYEIINGLWKILKKYGSPESGSEYWDAVAGECVEKVKNTSWKNKELAMDLFSAVLNHLDREAKRLGLAEAYEKDLSVKVR